MYAVTGTFRIEFYDRRDLDQVEMNTGVFVIRFFAIAGEKSNFPRIHFAQI